LLPFVLMFMLLLVNRSDLMGRFTNSKGYNIVAWSAVGMVAALALVLVVFQLLGTG
jgi:Mn2+/Fe2+ NRAMP family transporter